jgi:hypothetical protein
MFPIFQLAQKILVSLSLKNVGSIYMTPKYGQRCMKDENKFSLHKKTPDIHDPGRIKINRTGGIFFITANKNIRCA